MWKHQPSFPASASASPDGTDADSHPTSATSHPSKVHRTLLIQIMTRNRKPLTFSTRDQRAEDTSQGGHCKPRKIPLMGPWTTQQLGNLVWMTSFFPPSSQSYSSGARRYHQLLGFLSGGGTNTTRRSHVFTRTLQL